MFFRDRLKQLSLGLEKRVQRGLFGSCDSAGILGATTCASDLAIQGLTTHQTEIPRADVARKEQR